MTEMSRERREELKRRAPTPEEVDALLDDSAWRERVERQVRELEDRLVEAVAHEAFHNRGGNAHMLRYWKDQIGAIVDTGHGEGGEG